MATALELLREQGPAGQQVAAAREARRPACADCAAIAKVVVAAATERKPKLSHPTGSLAPRLKVLRRIVPARTFDKLVRKFNRMTP
ncbi:hypothetical protein [Streptomyces sp. NBC_01235]|uniref:hypothetical protein n=1 Tax=Streptomyces sp. NBC_01235 TaxID=2903788 RepID=UPI002E15B82F|nr:hypothetical protein OG289_02935 [Streptomyces sp. NBC_01235]